MRPFIAIVVLATSVVACSDDDAPTTFACDQSSAVGTCVEHGSLDLAEVEYGKGYCEASAGVWLVNEPCPTTDRVTSCHMPPARGGGFQVFYSNCEWIDGAEPQCTMNGGTWTTY